MVRFSNISSFSFFFYNVIIIIIIIMIMIIIIIPRRGKSVQVLECLKTVRQGERMSLECAAKEFPRRMSII